MSAYLNYEIHGRARSGDVSIKVRALAKPSLETATWLIREKYPSAENVTITIPAAHRYPTLLVDALKAATLATTPARRTK